MLLVKNTLTVLLSLQLLLWLPAPPTSALNKVDLYQEALQAKARGDLTQAVTLFQKALAKKPDFAEARFQLGLVFVELKRWKEAESAFQTIVQSQPDSYEAHNNLAAIYARQGKTDALGKELKALARLKPDQPQMHLNLADHYMTLALRSLWNAYRTAPESQKPELGARVTGIVAASPDRPDNYFIQGHIARLRGDGLRARELYTRAAQLDPDYQPENLLEEAKRLDREGASEEAMDVLMALSTVGYRSLDADLLTAEILVKRKDFQNALKQLEHVSTTPNTDVAHLKPIARIYRESGQLGKAIPYLEAALARDGSPDTRRQLAEAYKANGDYTKAVGEYEKLLSTESDPAWVHREIMNLTKQKLLAAETTNAVRTTASESSGSGPRIPDSLLLLPVNTRCAVVEKETQTLLLYHSTNSGIVLEKTYACSTGAKGGEKAEEGDEKTPEGIYLFRRILPGNQLPKIYGKMAVTLDYPNSYDRLEGKGGDGIWVHATNEPIRPYLPNKTRGCVVISNDDIEELSRLLILKQTPLVIVPKIQYQTEADRKAELKSLESLLSNWRTYWEDKEIEKYISVYSARFRNGPQNLKAWKAYKEAVFARAGKIQLRTDLQSIVRHEKYAVLTFHQDYRSHRLTSRGMKRLFVVPENGQWKIIAEDWMEK
jgi:murein L,D-transpeptidase YafK/thioredoxin-like negative regulator of GroEL